jgi:hypothetical protein
MKRSKKLMLNRETLRDLADSAALRAAAGGATTPITKCAATLCAETCVPKLCNPSGPPICSVHVICGQ